MTYDNDECLLMMVRKTSTTRSAESNVAKK